MVPNDPSPERTDSSPTPLSVLRELLDCTELNMDDIEPYTREVLARARAVIDGGHKEKLAEGRADRLTAEQSQ